MEGGSSAIPPRAELSEAAARNMLAVVVQDGALADGEALAVHAHLLDAPPVDGQNVPLLLRPFVTGSAKVTAAGASAQPTAPPPARAQRRPRAARYPASARAAGLSAPTCRRAPQEVINVDCPGTLYLMELESLQLAHYRASTWSITLQPAGVACSCTFFLFDSSGRCDGHRLTAPRPGHSQPAHFAAGTEVLFRASHQLGPAGIPPVGGIPKIEFHWLRAPSSAAATPSPPLAPRAVAMPIVAMPLSAPAVAPRAPCDAPSQYLAATTAPGAAPPFRRRSPFVPAYAALPPAVSGRAALLSAPPRPIQRSASAPSKVDRYLSPEAQAIQGQLQAAQASGLYDPRVQARLKKYTPIVPRKRATPAGAGYNPNGGAAVAGGASAGKNPRLAEIVGASAPYCITAGTFVSPTSSPSSPAFDAKPEEAAAAAAEPPPRFFVSRADRPPSPGLGLAPLSRQNTQPNEPPSPVDPKMLLDAETLHALLDEGPLTGAQLAARTLTGGGSSGSASATASLDDQNDACLDAMLKFFA